MLEGTIGLMTRSLGACARRTRLDGVLDEGADIWPSIVTADEFEGAVLTEMAREWVVVEVAENTES